METEYNQKVKELEEIVGSRANTFESSLLYSKEISGFLEGTIKGLNDKYSKLLDNISDIKGAHNNSNYSNTFGYLSEATTNIKQLQSDLEIINTKVKNASKSTYDEFNSKFNSLKINCNGILSNIKHKISSYNEMSLKLRRMNVNDPEYNGISYARKQISDSINRELHNINSLLDALKVILDKGLKKV